MRQETGNPRRLEQIIGDPSSDLPPLARELCRELLDQIAQLATRIDALKKTIDTMSEEAETSRCLQATASDA